MLKAHSPAGHEAIAAVWLVSTGMLLLGVVLFLLGSVAWLPAAAIGGAGLGLGLIAFFVRLSLHRGRVARAERLIDAGDIEGARAVLSPMLAAFPEAPDVERAAGILLYVAGDPLSAASLLERALPRVGPDPALATTLVASYAALNKGGDARRAARLLPEHVDVRLALAWSELCALAGDREAGGRIVRDLAHGPDARTSDGRRAMTGALVAIAAAQTGCCDQTRAALHAVEAGAAGLAAADRAFLGYLGGVALRECRDTAGARLTFSGAIEIAPDSIGGALARRERSHLSG